MPKPSPRRDGREAAIQYWFGHEQVVDGEADADCLPLFWGLRKASKIAREFAEELIHGMRSHQSEIDSTIEGALENFRLERLTTVDRNVLRLGVYEMLYADYIPAEAAINEAIEIAKRFGADESPKFINGVLDRIHRESK